MGSPPQPVFANALESDLEVHDAVFAGDAVAKPPTKDVLNAFERDGVGNHQVHEVGDFNAVLVHIDESAHNAVEVVVCEKFVHLENEPVVFWDIAGMD